MKTPKLGREVMAGAVANDPKLPSPNPRKLQGQGSHQFIAWLLYKPTAGRKWSPLVGPVVSQPQSTQQPQQYARAVGAASAA